MATPAEPALSVLHGLREDSVMRPAEFSEGPDWEGRVSGTIGALSAVGLLSEAERSDWTADAQHADLPPNLDLPPESADVAARLLSSLLEAVAEQGEREGFAEDRFGGALEALSAIGLVDDDEWDGRLRQQLGRPSAEEEWELTRKLNAGGTEQELIAALFGGEDVVDGTRVVYALRFVDGISFLLHREPSVTRRRRRADWDIWDCELRDDLGTEYFGSSHSGSDDYQHASFRTTVPAEASWIELVTPGGGAFRVIL